MEGLFYSPAWAANPHSSSPGKERLSGHFYSLCASRALLLNTVATRQHPAAACSTHSPGQFTTSLSLFIYVSEEGEQ